MTQAITDAEAQRAQPDAGVAEEERPDRQVQGPRTTHHEVVIVGGGTGGVAVAARLLRTASDMDVAVVEPSRTHYYQPLWTLVGGGVFPKVRSMRPMKEVLPSRAVWYRDAVARIDPERNQLTTADERVLSYDALVLAPGIQVDWERIPGLVETLGRDGVCSNYAYRYVEYTWRCIRELRSGRAVFTQPGTPIKCGGAPQKIAYLAADHFRQAGRAEDVAVEFRTATGAIFGVPEYARTLEGVAARYGIAVRYGQELAEIRPDTREAVFRGENEEDVVRFDMLHVTPPQSAPELIKRTGLADDGGWIDVDPVTLQHRRVPNVFGLGDASSAPTSKTGAAVRKQAPAVADNLLQVLRRGEIDEPVRYDGYTACPLVTGYGRLVLAEFDYEKNLRPSFPVDSTKERASMYQLKKWGLPAYYWNLLLKGRG